MITEELERKFLTNTDESGRFIVTSIRTGRRYFVEPVGDPHVEWGSVYPGDKELHHKKGDGKFSGSVHPKESLITEENGFDKVHTLPPGTSPLAAIDFFDSKYPDRVLA
jgi:hypothetical protein